MHLPTLAHRMLDFCFPRQCPSCDDFHESATLLCDECEAEMTKLSAAPRCGHCAMPAKEHGAPCPHCLSRGLRPFDRVVCIGVLRDPIKAVIHQAKYAARWTLAEYLADRAMQREDVRRLLDNVDCLAPVPLHRRRQVQRGYNQSDVVARRMAGNLAVVSPAMRVRDTRTQTELRSREARAENLRDAFLLANPNVIADRRVVLVDDVMTSGATLLSLARTLKPAKPASLSAIVMAVADPKGRAFEVV